MAAPQIEIGEHELLRIRGQIKQPPDFSGLFYDVGGHIVAPQEHHSGLGFGFGAMSLTWQNWEWGCMSGLILFDHETTSGLRVPPKPSKPTSTVTVDGGMPGPGVAEGEPSNGFTRGDWAMPFMDQAGSKVVDESLAGQSDKLLGRWTDDF